MVYLGRSIEREMYFGDIINVKMNLSKAGKIAAFFWPKLLDVYGNIKLHEFVVMPNHLHGIIEIYNGSGCGNAPRQIQFEYDKKKQ